MTIEVFLAQDKLIFIKLLIYACSSHIKHVTYLPSSLALFLHHAAVEKQLWRGKHQAHVFSKHACHYDKITTCVWKTNYQCFIMILVTTTMMKMMLRSLLFLLLLSPLLLYTVLLEQQILHYKMITVHFK